jgi:hypothetical protein
VSSSAGPDPSGDGLDLAELAATLLSEVRAGIAASDRARAAGDAGPDVEVVEAVVRVGEPAVARGSGEAGGGAGPPATPGLVAVGDRPGAGSGWQVELRLRRGTVDGALGDPVVPVGGGTPVAVALWDPRPPTDLKGVDRVRASRLADHGVRTIAELLALDEAAVAAIVARERSHRYLDAWVQVNLLRVAAPALGRSGADGDTLAALAGRAPTALRERIGPRACSRSAATQLFDLLAAWSVALDRRALASVTLGDLRRATRPG